MFVHALVRLFAILLYMSCLEQSLISELLHRLIYTLLHAYSFRVQPAQLRLLLKNLFRYSPVSERSHNSHILLLFPHCKWHHGHIPFWCQIHRKRQCFNTYINTAREDKISHLASLYKPPISDTSQILYCNDVQWYYVLRRFISQGQINDPLFMILRFSKV